MNDNGSPRRAERGELIYEEEDCFGYGIIGAAGRNGITHCCLLSEPFTDTVKRNFDKLIQQEDIDEKRAYLTRWDDEEKKVIAVAGPMPETFKEFIDGEGCD